MNHHNLKFALRHLWKRKLYTIVILLSLSIGFTCSHLLISFLTSELSVDSFHANKDRTFQIFSNDPFGGDGSIAYIPDGLSAYLASHYPEVEGICRIGQVGNPSFETPAGTFNDIQLITVDSSFFSIFTFPLAKGNVERALGQNTIILSANKARILFGEESLALGQTLTIRTSDSTQTVTVSGILAERQVKSHLQFDALLHHGVLKNNTGGGATYVTVNDRSAANGLTDKINRDPARPGLVGEGKMNYTLKSLEDSYFNKDNRMPYMKTRSVMFIRVCTVVCGLIFVMASFNFINLFLLSLQTRKKEMGIKKTLGATLSSLVRSSTSEVLLYVFAGMVLSLLITYSLLPVFNRLLNSSLDIEYLLGKEVVLLLGAMVLILVFSVVIISALHQWRVGAISVMRNLFASRTSFNRSFFLIQFIVSAILIICALTIIRQMDFIEKEPLGFNREIIQVQAPARNMSSNLHTLKQALSQTSGIDRVTVCNGNPISGNSIVRYELESGEFYSPYVFSGDENFVKTLQLVLLEGELLTTGNDGKLVNETLVKTFGLHQPIGQKIPGTDDRIAGVVRDFTCVSFKNKIPPVIISLNPIGNRLLISYSGKDLPTLLGSIQREWARVFPDHVFAYQVIQDDLLNKYKDERFFYEIILASSIISVIISCFGLFALSWAVVQSRIREIGIRKILGATPGNIVNLLALTFMKRIALAFAISAPMAYYLMQEWLSLFAYKVTLDFAIFLLAAAIVTAIAVITLALQTFKAAVVDPVKELKAQ